MKSIYERKKFVNCKTSLIQNSLKKYFNRETRCLFFVESKTIKSFTFSVRYLKMRRVRALESRKKITVEYNKTKRLSIQYVAVKWCNTVELLAASDAAFEYFLSNLI